MAGFGSSRSTWALLRTAPEEFVQVKSASRSCSIVDLSALAIAWAKAASALVMFASGVAFCPKTLSAANASNLIRSMRGLYRNPGLHPARQAAPAAQLAHGRCGA